LNISIEVGKWEDFLNGSYDVTKFCGILVQSPNSDGILNDFTELFRKINEINPKVVKVVGADLMALSITKPPGEMGADICYGSSQRLGIPMGFGGPHAGFFATKKDYVRKMPGKIIGISKDKDDYLAFRMALQTREQHIRREKATSNICTAQVLLANLSAMYAIYHGPKGLREISFRINRIAQKCERIFKYYGFQTLTQGMTNCPYFDTITIINCDAIKLRDAFLELEINIRVNNESSVSLSFS
jgi:glycine dehydrogenase